MTQNNAQAFQLKGSLFPFSVFQLLTADIDAILSQAESMTTKLPNFFQHTPVILDLDKLDHSSIVDFDKLNKRLKQLKIIPVAVRNGLLPWHQQAISVGMAILPASRTENTPIEQVEAPIESPPSESPAEASILSKIVQSPIRSGQQIYARDSDLIVMGSVSPGAEILADGNIHIYGVLRGRAMAGVQGNIQARIFCRHLDAELISIAGYYQIKDEMQLLPAHENLCISLVDQKLLFESI